MNSVNAVKYLASFDDLGSFHTSEYWGGVQRRQMELKGVEGGD